MVTVITSSYRTILAILLAMYGSLLFAATPSVSVTVVISGDSSVYESAVEGIKRDLSQFTNYNFTVTTKNLSRESIEAINSFKTDYIVTIGSRATIEVIQRQPNVPVLSIMVTQENYREIRAALEVVNPEIFSVIYLDQPAVRTIALAKILAGKNTAQVGMLFGPTSKNKRQQYMNVAESLSMDPITEVEPNGENSIEKITDILDNSDVYLAIYDRKVLNRKTAKWLLYLANLRRIPVIGYSSAYVDAGALAAIYTKPIDLGQDAAKWIIENITNKNTEKWDAYPELFTVNVNRKIARRLNRSIASEKEIVSMIRSIESNYE